MQIKQFTDRDDDGAGKSSVSELPAGLWMRRKTSVSSVKGFYFPFFLFFWLLNMHLIPRGLFLLGKNYLLEYDL